MLSRKKQLKDTLMSKVESQKILKLKLLLKLGQNIVSIRFFLQKLII